MSDPAIEAAQRALLQSPNFPVGGYGEACAREALKPIRELHKPRPDRYAVQLTVCDGCGWTTKWPCATAKLIYTTEELS